MAETSASNAMPFGRVLLASQVVCVAVSPVIAAGLVPSSPWWIILAAVAAGGAVVLAEARKRHAERRGQVLEESTARARTDSRTAMVSSLQPIATSLAGIVTSTKAQRQEMLGVITQAIVVAAVRQVSAEGVRGGWYSHDVTPDGRRVLRRTCSDGRNDTTDHTEFQEGTVEGDAALDMVDRDDHLYIVDLAKEPPEGWEKRRVRRYRTFISAGISAKGQPLGMLTVDALEPGALSDEDLQTVLLLASMLRVGLAADL